jgi:hypothetical protein
MTGIWVGMHHYVAEYVGLNEIWISDKLPIEERSRVILHEFTERSLMENGMAYDLAHIEALKTEGNISEAEIKERSYISPEEIKHKLDSNYTKNEDGTWQLKQHVLKYDSNAGIIYVYDGEKISDQLLIRSIDDIEEFINKFENTLILNFYL